MIGHEADQPLDIDRGAGHAPELLNRDWVLLIGQP